MQVAASVVAWLGLERANSKVKLGESSAEGTWRPDRYGLLIINRYSLASISVIKILQYLSTPLDLYLNFFNLTPTVLPTERQN